MIPYRAARYEKTFRTGTLTLYKQAALKSLEKLSSQSRPGLPLERLQLAKRMAICKACYNLTERGKRVFAFSPGE